MLTVIVSFLYLFLLVCLFSCDAQFRQFILSSFSFIFVSLMPHNFCFEYLDYCGIYIGHILRIICCSEIIPFEKTKVLFVFKGGENDLSFIFKESHMSHIYSVCIIGQYRKLI